MGKEQLITTIKLPDQFIEIVDEFVDQELVNLVIVGKHDDQFEIAGKIRKLSEMAGYASFDPQRRNILINIHGVLGDPTWIKRGIRIGAAVWMSLIYGFFHELVHAYQMKNEPKLKNLWELPREYEQEATDIGMVLMSQWLAEHHLPHLEELGFLGEEILRFFIMKTQTNNKEIMEIIKYELCLNGTDVAAELHLLAQQTKEIEENEIERLMSHIDEGIIGKKINNKYYLTAYEAVSCA